MELRDDTRLGRGDLQANNLATRTDDPNELAKAQPKVGDVTNTKGHRRCSKTVVFEGQVQRIAVDQRGLVDAALGNLDAAAIQHALCKIETNHFTTRANTLGEIERQVGCAAAAIEHAGSSTNLGRLGCEASPADVKPTCHDAIHRVIGTSDAIEHCLNALGRQRALFGAVLDGEIVIAHASAPQRGKSSLSMPQRSSTRPATKSIASFSESGCV